MWRIILYKILLTLWAITEIESAKIGYYYVCLSQKYLKYFEFTSIPLKSQIMLVLAFEAKVHVAILKMELFLDLSTVCNALLY